MSDIQLPDYPWEHPQESDYEEARLPMSDSETLVERLLKDRAPAIFEAARMAAARIAELEADLSAQQQTAANLAAYTARIAELEALVSRLDTEGLAMGKAIADRSRAGQAAALSPTPSGDK